MIGFSISDKHLENRSDVFSIKERWKSVHNTSARRKLLPYLNGVVQLAGTRNAISVNVDDKNLATAVLHRLASSNEHPIATLSALGKEDHLFTFESVKSRLVQEEQRSEMGQANNIKVLNTSVLMLDGSKSHSCRYIQPLSQRSPEAKYKCSNLVLTDTQPVAFGVVTFMDNVLLQHQTTIRRMLKIQKLMALLVRIPLK